MNELTLNGMNKDMVAEDILEFAVNELSSLKTRVSKVAYMIGEYVSRGGSRQIAMERTGIKKSAISQMCTAWALYNTFILGFFDADAVKESDFEMMMTIPYVNMYNMRHMIKDYESTIYDKTFDSAVEVLRDCNKGKNLIEKGIEDDKEGDVEENVEAKEIDEKISIELYKENVGLIVDIIEAYLTNYDSSKDEKMMITDVLKQLKAHC